MTRLAVSGPLIEGVNTTLTVHDEFAAMLCPQVVVLSDKVRELAAAGEPSEIATPLNADRLRRSNCLSASRSVEPKACRSVELPNVRLRGEMVRSPARTLRLRQMHRTDH